MRARGPAVCAAVCRLPRFLCPGCSIIRASLTVARMVSLPRFGSLWAFGPSAHRPHASLRAFGHSKRSRAAGAGEARTHGASGGRGDAPTAAGAGACSGAFVGRCGGAWPGGDSCGVRGDAFLASRLLNHSRFPDGRAHGFAAPLRVALGLRPKCPQGTRFPSRRKGARNARAQRGRGRPAPMARAVGAGTRLPRRERAHATGLLPTGTRSMARRGQPRGAARRVSCAFQALATLASPAFAAKTADATASGQRAGTL